MSVVSSAIVVQLRELELACESAFSTMSRIPWNAVNQVTGQSPYAHKLNRVAKQNIETTKPHVEQKKYLRNLFDKACRYDLGIGSRNNSLTLIQFDTHQVYESFSQEPATERNWGRTAAYRPSGH
jgi:hypothetical protein